jgi:hypothetical protein
MLLVGFVIGLVLGVLLGAILFWGLFPVQWTDAQTYHLAPEAKAEFVGLVADSFALTKNVPESDRHLATWSLEEKQQAVADAMQSFEATNQFDKAQRVQDLAMALKIPLPTEVPPEPSAAESSATGLWNRLRVPCLVFLLLLLALVLGLLGIRALLQRRPPRDESGAPRTQRPPSPARAEAAARGAPAPVGRFTTTYQLGEDTYDESFSIEGANSEFLGECGMGISELIGEGQPDKVAAFEVWLFDKSEIRTVTKVLMSDYAYADDVVRARLAPKGEAVVARPGLVFDLETNSLKVQVAVAELEYGTEGLPPNSYFDRLVVEMVTMARTSEPRAD